MYLRPAARAVAWGVLVTAVGLATACSASPSPSGPDDPGTVAGFPTDLGTAAGGGGGVGDGGGAGGPTEGTGGGTGAGEVTACSLLTAQEAAAALGVAAVATSSGSAADCLYQDGGNSVIVGYTTETDRSQADLLLALGAQRIDGVGDEAVQITQPPLTQVHVWMGDKHLQIVVTRESGDTAGPARSLLDSAMARLSGTHS